MRKSVVLFLFFVLACGSGGDRPCDPACDEYRDECTALCQSLNTTNLENCGDSPNCLSKSASILVDCLGNCVAAHASCCKTGELDPWQPDRDTLWPDNLYQGEIVFQDTLAPDYVTDNKPISYDTDYHQGEGVVVLDAYVNPDQIVDGVCIPDCVNDDGSEKECGLDGCGSLCGYCPMTMECNPQTNTCAPQCTPDCDGKSCGFDGCYSDCPPGCEPDFACTPLGTCVPDCQPKCEGKECGSDECGGSCGSCPANEVCNYELGSCDPHPCFGVDLEKGECQDDVLIQCIGDQLEQTDCQALGEDYYCGFNTNLQVFECQQGCVPQCTFEDGTAKQCGYDGCLGICGTCTEGWTCEAGLCYAQEGADCGSVTETGMCNGNLLYYCHNGMIMITDCAENGFECAFDTSVTPWKYQCVAGSL